MCDENERFETIESDGSGHGSSVGNGPSDRRTAEDAPGMHNFIGTQGWCNHPLSWGGWGMAVMFLIAVGAVALLVGLAVREKRFDGGRPGRERAAAVLRELYEHGEVSAEAYRRVQEALRRS
jgi:uncharacterized membrane protein